MHKNIRILWAIQMSKIIVYSPNVGWKTVYTTNGLRWQIRREFNQFGKWSANDFIKLITFYFSSGNAPTNPILFGGGNFLLQIPYEDIVQRTGIRFFPAKNPIGINVIRVESFFGTLDIVYERTFDIFGWSNSGAIIDADELIHYINVKEKTEAFGLVGNNLIWINGEF